MTVYRAVNTNGDATTMYAWLCQLRRAPYSYDWIDNLGRRSPARRDPGLEHLEIGQSFMSIFNLIDFEPGQHITLEHRGRLFGHVALTYRVVALDHGGCRVVAKLMVRYPPRSLLRLPMRTLMPVGDLIMMRRQLLNLADLASK